MKKCYFEYWLEKQHQPIFKTIKQLEKVVTTNTTEIHRLKRKINNSNKRIRTLEERITNLENGGNNND